MIGHADLSENSYQENDENGDYLPSSFKLEIYHRTFARRIEVSKSGFTDDMEMGAIIKNYGMGEAAKMAFKAGNDQLLICANHRRDDRSF